MTQAPEPTTEAIIAEIQGSSASERNKAIALGALHGETYAAMGRAHGISGDRVKQIALREHGQARMRLTNPFGHLSVRTWNALRNNNIATAAQLRDYVAEHGHPLEWVKQRRWPNFGRKTALEVAEFLGLPNSLDAAAPRCPHCGQIIR